MLEGDILGVPTKCKHYIEVDKFLNTIQVSFRFLRIFASDKMKCFLINGYTFAYTMPVYVTRSPETLSKCTVMI